MKTSEDLAGDLARAYLLMNRRVDRAMTQSGASLAQTKLLLLIAASEGAARAADIAELFGQAPRTVTEALDKLEAAGLIRRTPDPNDRRVKRLALTPAGEATIASGEPLRRQLVEDVFAPLDRQERATLHTLLAKLYGHLSADDFVFRPFGESC